MRICGVDFLGAIEADLSKQLHDSLPGRLSTSRPQNRIVPPSHFACGASKRSSALASVLFPQPDSPSIPTISPERTSMLTPSKARIGSPSSAEYATVRSRTCAKHSLELSTKQLH